MQIPASCLEVFFSIIYEIDLDSVAGVWKRRGQIVPKRGLCTQVLGWHKGYALRVKTF